MTRVAIMTDSNCGIMPGYAPHPDIHVLPMPVIINERTYYEGIDLSPEDFYRMQAEGAEITTSQPSPGEVTAMWERLLGSYDQVVFIPMSSGLSNTCQTARVMAEDDAFAGRVFVVDNRRISVTQLQSVLDAAAMASRGKTGAAIRDTLEQEALDASIYIAVDTLEYLKKGGRITPAAAAIGTVLRLKPILTIQGDKLDSFAKTRGMKSAFHTMVHALKHDIDTRFSSLRDQALLKVGIANTLLETEKLESFKEEMRKEFPHMDLVSAPLTMSIGTHIGPGALGVGVFRCH